MAISRRKFLKAGSLVLLSAGIPLKVVAEELSGPPSRLTSLKGSSPNGLHSLTEAIFASQLNTTFKVGAGASDVVNIKLTSVKDIRSAADKESPALRGRECFSLVFIGPERTPLKQNTYVFEHQALGKFPILLVPVGESEQGLHYEAVFNRLR